MTTTPIDVQRIESLHLLTTEPPEQLEYDGWLVRRAPNDVKRARSVNAFAASTRPLDEKIAHCERLYAEAGLPSLFRITPLMPSDLDAVLATRGYERIDHTLQQVARLDRALPDAPAGLSFRDPPLDEWLSVAGPLRGQPAAARDSERRRLRRSGLPMACVLASANGEDVACGLVMLAGEYATLMDIAVAEAWRGRGIGAALSAHLLTKARQDGATVAWLNVLADNTPAVRTYARLGFETLYEYWYRIKPMATP